MKIDLEFSDDEADLFVFLFGIGSGAYLKEFGKESLQRVAALADKVVAGVKRAREEDR